MAMEKKTTKTIGNNGEDIAVRHLKRLGYKIMDRNYHSRFGEIDIIAKHGEYYVFTEVKYRKSDGYGGGAGAVGKIKQERIIKTAQFYIAEKGLDDLPVRFDVVLVGTKTGAFGIKKAKVEVLENAFGI